MRFRPLRRDRYRRNLLLLHSQGQQAMSDWEAIKARIESRAVDIEVRIDSNDDPDPATARWQVSRPSLVFSPLRLLAYRPSAGRVYAGGLIGKIEEWQRLTAAGLPFPRTARLTPDLAIDPADWGEYAIVKPAAGLRGRGVRLIRTADVAFRFAELTDRARQRMLVQEFVDGVDEIGRPTSYRCLTMFGRTLSLRALFWTEPRRALAEIAAGDGRIASNYEDVSMSDRLDVSADIMALAVRVAAAFPEIPCLGQDFVRDRKTGALLILETNPSGAVWHLSSAIYRRYHAHDTPHMEARYAQFNALDMAADLLIERTRAEAL